MALPSVCVELEEGGGLPLGLTTRKEPRLQLIIGQVDIPNGVSDDARAGGRDLIECQCRGARYEMDSAGVPLERIGQGCRDDRGDVAGVHMAGRGRAERTVEFTARLDWVGRPQQVLHEEGWLDERERQATIHDETFGCSVLPSEGK